MRQPDLAVFAATSGHSGVDRNLRKLIPAFAERGVRVDLLTIDGHGPYWADGLPAGARVVPLGAAHVNTSVPALIRYLRRWRPRALLSDKDKVNRAALLARALSGAPTRVAVRIGTTVSKNLERRGPLSRWVQYRSIRWFYPRADAIIVPSHGVAADLNHIAGRPLPALTVIPSPVVDPDLYRQAGESLAQPWFEPGQPPVILGVGELCARKDFTTLIRAFAEVRGQRPCRLLILGEGRQRSKLEALVATLGIGADVAMPGFVPNPYAYMARAAVFALTSTCEGSPVVLIEALANGMRIVSTDCPSGPRETLRDGRYGTLVAIGDTSAVAGALHAALDQPPLDGWREAVQPFTVAASAQGYLRALGLA